MAYFRGDAFNSPSEVKMYTLHLFQCYTALVTDMVIDELQTELRYGCVDELEQKELTCNTGTCQIQTEKDNFF